MTNGRMLAGMLLLVGLAACGGDSSKEQAVSSDFYGIYTDQSGAEGTITLVGAQQALSADLLAPATARTLSGTLAIAGSAPIALSGTFDASTGNLFFEDNASTYAFSANVFSFLIYGSGNGPGGSAVFALIHGGTAASADVYCGTGVCTA